MKHLLAIGVLVLSAWLSGCSTGGYVKIPELPKWQQPADAKTYSASEVSIAIAQIAPLAQYNLTDSTFTPVSHEWLEKAVTWSWYATGAVRFTYTPESGDCDKFALGFAFCANLAAMKASVKAQPLVARIHVYQVKEFGGVGAGGGHALNAFMSDRAPYFYVLEPQTRKLVPLSEYPNRGSIFRVLIGG